LAAIHGADGQLGSGSRGDCAAPGEKLAEAAEETETPSGALQKEATDAMKAALASLVDIPTSNAGGQGAPPLAGRIAGFSSLPLSSSSSGAAGPRALEGDATIGPAALEVASSAEETTKEPLLPGGEGPSADNEEERAGGGDGRSGVSRGSKTKPEGERSTDEACESGSCSGGGALTAALL